jgi:tetratricopeptide (TPR) repeat protein
MARLRSADNQPELRAVSPRQTVVRGLPTFAWELTDPATDLKLTVYNEEGVHWQHDVHGTTSMAYPDDAPALAPGTAYSWTLETTDPLKFPPLRSQAAFFEVLAAEDDKKLTAALDDCSQDNGDGTSESAKHVVRASLFFEYNLLDDAIAETKQAIAVDPENPALHSILARLYAQTGRSAEALDEYNKLQKK